MLILHRVTPFIHDFKVMTEDEIKLKSYSYLSKLYATSGAHVLNPIKGLQRLGNELGLENDETNEVLIYLDEEGLAVIYFNEDKISITNRGISAIEEAELNPTIPTCYFPPIIEMVSVGKTEGFRFFEKGSKTTLDKTISSVKYNEIKKSVEMIMDSIDKLDLDPELKSKLRAELITMEVQISLPRPDIDVIRDCVSSTRKILEAATDNLLVRRLLSQLVVL
ncbi:MAG: hypothetical protein ACE5H1_04950 [Thermodesulfobacteriota bacterium]